MSRLRGKHVFVSIKGSPYAHFRRALALGDLTLIRLVAAELPGVALDDALQVCLLMAQQRDASFDRAAVRWLARFALEAATVGLEDIDEALSALMLMPDEPDRGRRRLADLGAAHGLRL